MLWPNWVVRERWISASDGVDRRTEFIRSFGEGVPSNKNWNRRVHWRVPSYTTVVLFSVEKLVLEHKSRGKGRPGRSYSITPVHDQLNIRSAICTWAAVIFTSNAKGPSHSSWFDNISRTQVVRVIIVAYEVRWCSPDSCAASLAGSVVAARSCDTTPLVGKLQRNPVVPFGFAYWICLAGVVAVTVLTVITLTIASAFGLGLWWWRAQFIAFSLTSFPTFTLAA